MSYFAELATYWSINRFMCYFYFDLVLKDYQVDCFQIALLVTQKEQKHVKQHMLLI